MAVKTTMELKDYQQNVLGDLSAYLQDLRLCGGNASAAFHRYWSDRGVALDTAGGSLHRYVDKVGGTPNVTLKVPTAGGKTFIACNALYTIFQGLAQRKGPKVAVWAVPSDTILTQTLRNLSDTSHPYRERLDTLFGNAVNVVGKEDALMGNGISPTELEEQLTIFVISVQSFVEIIRKKKGGNAEYLDLPRVYRENGALAVWQQAFRNEDVRVNGADETSLIQYIASLHPVMVIDESHNFGSLKRTDLLQNLNPDFILDLTATPREDSNIISFVDALRLKRNNMVKLPVIVYNKYDKNGVIDDAVSLRSRLERIANEEHTDGGRYVRPIVLFQAEPKNADDTETFAKIRRALIEQKGIKEEQIKVKVSGHDELRGIDLMSKDCPVRYIITVNALKEGWDCPFAYILATVANRSSRVDVEQVLGRILRQPHTQPFHNRMLNMCYVLTCSDKFNDTLQNIIRSMQMCGFSGRDYRVGVDEQEARQAQGNTAAEPVQPILPFSYDEPEDEDGEFALEPYNETEGNTPNTDLLAEEAIAQSEQYDKDMAMAERNEEELPKEVTENMKFYHIIDRYRQDATRLPNLFLVKRGYGDIFTADGNNRVEVSMNNLLEGFDLRNQKSDINLADSTEMSAVDVEERQSGEYVATIKSLSDRDKSWLKERIDTASDELKCSQLAETIANHLSDDDDTITSAQYSAYVKNLLSRYDSDTLKQFVDRIVSVEGIIRNYVIQLKREYVDSQFDKMLAKGRIEAVESWSFPEKISFTGNPIVGLGKALYTEEQNVNGFEWSVINKISQLDNVEFWHRNQTDKQGFHINGFIHNHYPDFIVRTKNGKIVLVETKGGHLGNADSAYKTKIGKAWANLAGRNYRYFMVFPDNAQPLKDSLTVNDMLEILRDL